MGQWDEGLETAKAAVALKRELAERDRDAFLPDFASSLHMLAALQGYAEHRNEGLETARAAVTLYRELVERNRDAFLRHLAASLNNLAIRQATWRSGTMRWRRHWKPWSWIASWWGATATPFCRI